MQFPNATNRYGTKGVTFAYDYRKKRFTELFGHDERTGQPVRWPGWSHWRMGDKTAGRTFVGGEGCIYELVDDSWWHDGRPAVMRLRTSHLMAGEMRIDDLRLILKRGVGKKNERRPIIRLRAQRDNRTYTRWVERDLGDDAKADLTLTFDGMGTATAWQFEVEVSADVDVVIRSIEMAATRMGF